LNCWRHPLSGRRFADREAPDNPLLAALQLLRVGDLAVQVSFELVQVADALFVVLHDSCIPSGFCHCPGVLRKPGCGCHDLQQQSATILGISASYFRGIMFCGTPNGETNRRN
jgi:hypothetical protein